MTKFLPACAVVALSLLAAPPARAYVPGGATLLKLAAEKQAQKRLEPVRLTGEATLFGARDAAETTASLDLTPPQACHARLALDRGGSSLVAVDRGRLSSEGTKVPALEALVALGCPLQMLRGVPAAEAEARLVALARSLGVNLKETSLSRHGRRTAYVVGARPRQDDKPQLWFDRQTLRPLRVVARHDGRLWDLRFDETGPLPLAGRASRRHVVWEGGRPQLALHLSAAGEEADVGVDRHNDDEAEPVD